jgi:hypothetical protein
MNARSAFIQPPERHIPSAVSKKQALEKQQPED